MRVIHISTSRALCALALTQLANKIGWFIGWVYGASQRGPDRPAAKAGKRLSQQEERTTGLSMFSQATCKGGEGGSNQLAEVSLLCSGLTFDFHSHRFLQSSVQTMQSLK